MLKPTACCPSIVLALSLLVAPMAQSRAGDERCPESIRSATRLLVVVSRDMMVVAATAQRFERASNEAAWSEIRPALPVVLGRRGLGWAWNQTSLADDGEPIKQEGDRRTPAGIFPIGPAFGFAAAGPGSDYLPLKRSESFCVNDVRSRHYNQIVPKSMAGAGITGESMGDISLYRRGLQLSFPTNREQQGGSCIFIHVWRGRNSPTLGCLALSESNVAELQTWAGETPALVAILPQNALKRLQDCLPGL